MKAVGPLSRREKSAHFFIYFWIPEAYPCTLLRTCDLVCPSASLLYRRGSLRHVYRRIETRPSPPSLSVQGGTINICVWKMVALLVIYNLNQVTLWLVPYTFPSWYFSVYNHIFIWVIIFLLWYTVSSWGFLECLDWFCFPHHPTLGARQIMGIQ